MFITLLGSVFLIALAVSALAAWLFARPVARVMERIVADEISDTWVRYLVFAVLVVGIGGGVRIRQIERYVTPRGDEGIIELTGDRWMIEIYSTIMGSLEAIAWMLLVFFLFALIAYVIVRAFEGRQTTEAGGG